MATDHPHGIENRRGVDAVAGDRFATNDHPHIRQASNLLCLHIRCPRHTVERADNLIALCSQHLEIIAIET